MSKKVPEIILSATPINGCLIWDNPEDVQRYCIEHDMEKIYVSMEPDAQLSKKRKMYAFYYRVILKCAVIGYTASGEPGIDEIKSDYLLRAEFCKDFIKNHKGEYVPVMLDKRNMTMPRLHKFLSDAIFFIETDLQVNVPDSETYKINRSSGHNFEKV